MWSGTSGSGGADPTLSLLASEQVTSGSTTPISGISYLDSSAFNNPGPLYIGITDNAGTLFATDTQGTAPGSGTDAIILSADYSDVASILNGLLYTTRHRPRLAPTRSASASIPVTITASAGGGPNETWTGATSGDRNTASNWSAGSVPTSGDTVDIPGGIQNNPTLANAMLSGETITLVQGSGAAIPPAPRLVDHRQLGHGEDRDE